MEGTKGRLYVEDVYAMYKDDVSDSKPISNVLFMKAVRCIWPDLVLKPGKKTDATGRCYSARYLPGMTYVNQAEKVPLEKLEPPLAQEWMMLQQDSFCIKFATNSGITRNGFRMLKEVMIKADGTCEMSLGDQVLFSFSNPVVGNFIQFVLNLSLCNGIQVKESDENAIKQVHEQNNKTIWVIFSATCRDVLLTGCDTKCYACKFRDINDNRPAKKATKVKDGTGVLADNLKLMNACEKPTRPVPQLIMEAPCPDVDSAKDLQEDFKKMCSEIGFSEDQIIFLNDQARNIKCKDRRNHRWHPK